MKSKSVTGRKMLSEYVYMIGVNLATLLLVTDILGVAAGTASFVVLAPLALITVAYAVYTTIRVTFFLDLKCSDDQDRKIEGEKQFTLGWLRWMHDRIEAVRGKFVAAGSFRAGGAK